MSPSPPSPSRPPPSRVTPDDSASVKPDALAESAVFDDLGAFAPASHASGLPQPFPAADASDDAGMQHMILELSRSADGLGAADQFGAVPAGSADGSAPRFSGVSDPDWAFDASLSVPEFLSTEMDPTAAFASLPMNLMDPTAPPPASVPAPPPPTPHAVLPGQHASASHERALASAGDAGGPSRQPLGGAALSMRDYSGLASLAVPPVDAKAPMAPTPEAPARHAPAGRMRSPASSASSAPGKSRVPTAVCPICSKLISANGANFRRHVEACRRQHGAKGASPASAPVAASAAGVASADAWGAATGLDELAGGGAHAASATQRRDQDLLNAVRRLELSITSLDMNARLCLRDALVSLSNKALNPQAAVTPEQEALNRAAEYLVLRMLFISGQQVLYTPPGTLGGEMAGAPDADGRVTEAGDAGDGTVAASTGGVRKVEDMEDTLAVGKTEDELGGP